jgi:hypothetical protein
MHYLHELNRTEPVKMIECSREKPWGMHQSLRDEHCPRCGWASPTPAAKAPAFPQRVEQRGWAVIAAGLGLPPSAAAA